MLTFVLVFVFLNVNVVVFGSGDTFYNYETKGPKQWPYLFPNCGLSAQSPIDIKVKETKRDATLKTAIHFTTTNVNGKFKIVNDGHKVSISIPAGTIRLDRLNYEVVSMHWHWGSTNTKGSEHAINGRFQPIELHIVTWNTNQYTSFDQAAVGKNGLAVVGILFEIKNEEDEVMNKITGAFNGIRKCEACLEGKGPSLSADFDIFDLNKLLPKSPKNYFRYNGSLTTPPCTENVLWTVMAKKKNISQRQLNLFRGLLEPNGNPMVNNFRPPQPLNGRDVFRSFKLIK